MIELPSSVMLPSVVFARGLTVLKVFFNLFLYLNKILSLLSVHTGENAIPGIVPAVVPSKTFHQAENEKPPSLHSCSVCGKDFPYASKLQRHLRTHSGERPFPCSMCEKRFPEKGLLMIHERVHTGEKPFPCTFCEKRFASQGELRLHRRTHTGERPYHCSICLKSFSRHWHLKTHLEAMHSEVVAGFTRKKFPCSDCEKSCNSAAELRDHQRTHTGERPYQCSFCDKRFALSGTLVRHERLHTGITPYHCSDCGKTFAQQWTLTTHMRTHTGEKPYSCTQCDKSFVAPGELRRHTRIHTGEKPYTCADCGRHFSLAGTLRNHKRSCTQNKNGSVTGVVSDPVQAAVGESSQQDVVNNVGSEVEKIHSIFQNLVFFVAFGLILSSGLYSLLTVLLPPLVLCHLLYRCLTVRVCRAQLSLIPQMVSTVTKQLNVKIKRRKNQMTNQRPSLPVRK